MIYVAIDYNKPLKMKTEIEGVEDKIELVLAGDVLLKIYNLACDIVNSGGIEMFNRNWKVNHPDWVYTGDSGDEYTRAYERYFKAVADEISNKTGSPYRLREHEPCLINFIEGWFCVYGYKE